MSFETLEPRILLSADLFPGLVQEPGQRLDDLRQVTIATLQTAPVIDLRVSGSDDAATDSPQGLDGPGDLRTAPDMVSGDFQLSAPGGRGVSGSYQFRLADLATGSIPRAIAFVDSALPDHEALVEALSQGAAASPAQLDIVVIDATRDGIDQVTASLESEVGLSGIYVFSHGSTGNLELGSSILNADNIDDYAVKLNRWHEALAPDGDILVYGCRIGSGSEGADLIARLADLTGADVAASDDDTGAATLGGNWQLERTAGQIDPTMLQVADALAGYPALLATARWDGGGDGTSWSDAANWIGDVLPGAGDTVIIDAAAGAPAITIGAAAGLINIQSLTSSRAITLGQGATLQTADITLAQDLTLAGGRIVGATVTVTGGAQIVGSSSGGVLEDVTLRGGAGSPVALLLAAYPAVVGVSGNLTLDQSSVALGNYARIDIQGAATTIGGTGSITFLDNTGPTAIRQVTASSTLTIGSGITIGGYGGTIGYSGYWGGPSSGIIVNNGVIGPDQAGTITIAGASLSNRGTLRALNGGSLSVQSTNWANEATATVTANGGTLTTGGTWSNAGTITATNSTVNLGGTFTVAGLGSFTRTGGAVNLTGQLNNAGAVLALTAATGSWNMAGGRIVGGTVTVAGGAQLVGTSAGGVLEDVTLSGGAGNPVALLLAAYPAVVGVSGNLTLNQSAVALGNYSRLDIQGAATTIGGTGRITFLDNVGPTAIRQVTAGATLTIGSGITIAGYGGTIGYSGYWGGPSSGIIVNNGVIGPDQAGTITIAGASATNRGTFRAVNGGSLVVQPTNWTNASGATITVDTGTLTLNGTWSNAGTITATNSTVNLGGIFTITGLGSFTRTGGAVNLTGQLNNAGAVLALTAATGSWNMAGGRIVGGTVTVAAGAQLVGTSSGGVLEDVTLKGGAANPVALLLAAYPAVVGVAGTLTLDGATVSLANYARLDLQGDVTFAGSGRFVFLDNIGPTAIRQVTAGATLTIGSGITIGGYGGTIGYSSYWGGPTSGIIVNNGVIGLDQAGTIYIAGASAINRGTFRAVNGGSLVVQPTSWSNEAVGEIVVDAGTLTLNGAWSNAGTIAATNSNVNLGGSFTIASLGSFTRTDGTVNLTGQLNNAAAVLALTAATGSWNMAGGRIVGGTVTVAGGAQLVGTSAGGVLEDVTLRSGAGSPVALLLAAYPAVVGIAGNLTLDQSSVALGNYARIDIQGAATTIGGTGTITFLDNIGPTAIRQVTAGSTLTIGSGITIGGYGGTIGYSSYWGGPSSGIVVNNGIIGPDQAGTITIAGASATNRGTFRAVNGGTLSIQAANWTNKDGTILINQGTVNLGGTVASSDIGTFVRTGGTVNIVGRIENAGAVLTLNAATGSWNLAGGRIVGGTVTFADGVQLLATGSGGVLEDVTLKGDASNPTVLLIVSSPGIVGVVGNLTLDKATVALGNYGRLEIQGDATTIGGTGTITFLDNNTPTAIRQMTAGATLTIGSGITIGGYGGTIGYSSYWGGPSSGIIVNNGIIGPDQAGTIYIAGAAATNNGTLRATGGGTLNLQTAMITNVAGGVLSGGTWRAGAGSTLRALFGLVRTNNATIELAGANARFYADSATTSTLAGLVANGSQGTIALSAGAFFTTLGDFANAGTIRVGEGSVLALSGALTQTAGRIDLQGGTVADHRPAEGPTLDFDGVDDFVSVADSPDLHSADELTVSGWFKADGFPRQWQSIFFKGETTSGSSDDAEYGLWLNAAGYLYFGSKSQDRAAGGLNEYSITTAPGSIQAGRWHHFAAEVSKGDNVMRLYVDGNLLAEGAYDQSGMIDSAGPLFLGSTPNFDAAFNGSIDDVAVWNVARAQAAVRADMYRRLGGSETGLQAYWTFDGNGGSATDLTGNGNTAYLGRSAASFPSWMQGGGLAFDGVDDTVQIADAPSIRPANALTVEAWVNVGSNFGSSPHIIVSKTVGTAYQNSFAIWYESGQLRGVGGNAVGTVSLGYDWTPPTDGSWHHVAYSIDAGGQKLYLDGEVVAESTATAALGYDSHPVVISGDYNYEQLGYAWAGGIRDVRLWNVARSSAAIKADMVKNLTGTEAGLVGLWKLVAGQGDIAADSTANANHGAFGTQYLTRPAWTTGPALSFDGVNDQVDMGDPQGSRLDIKGDATLSAWVKFDRLPQNTIATIASKDVGAGNQAKWIFGYANNYGGVAGATTLHINNPSGGGSIFLASDAWTPATGVWYHISVVKQGNDYTFYRDGVAQGTATSTVEMPDSGASFIVGRAENSFAFAGSIRGVDLWSVARTPEQLQAVMTTPPSGSEAGLAGSWRFDEATGNIAHDRTSAGNHGYLADTPARRPILRPADGDAPNEASVSFDGIDDLIKIGDLGPRPPSGSIAFWMNPASVDSFRNVLTTGPLTNGSSLGNAAIRFEQNSAGSLSAVIGTDTGTFTAHTLAGNLQAGQWVHVTLTWDEAESRVRGYIDGEQVFDHANSTWPTAFNDVQFGGGYWSFLPERYFKGQLAEVQFWNRELDPGEVAAGMQPLTGSEAGLIGYWPLDEATGTTAADGSAGGHNGTFGSGTPATMPLWANRHAVKVDIQGGSITGKGVIATDVTNAGQVVVGGASAAGALVVTGDFTQTSAGTTRIELGGLAAGTQSDQLVVDGTAALAGTLAVTAINGFTPASGDSFRVVTYGSQTSQFATITGLGAGLTPLYEAEALVLSSEAGDIRVTPTSGLVTTEAGGTASFQVVLGAAPTADVTINVASSDPSEGTVSTTRLVFTAANWNRPQTVTVTGVNDFVDDGDIQYRITLAAAVSDDPRYSGFDASDVTVTNTDDDTAGITVAPQTLQTSEGGPARTFTVVLNSQPTANVVIPISSSNLGEGRVNVTSLTFTPQNWNVAQTVRVTPVDDSVVDGDVAYTILTGAARSNDANYDGRNPADVAVVNIDNDRLDLQVGGLTIQPAAGLQSGNAVTVRWTVNNVGTIATDRSFSDQLTVRNTTTGQVLATFPVVYNHSGAGNGPIEPGTSRQRQATITLPDGATGVGDIQFSVTVNHAGEIGENDATNNTATLTQASTLAPYPDLQVRNLKVDPASELFAGGSVTISWDDANTGTGATGKAWVDRVTVRNKTTGQTFVTSLMAYDPAAAGNGVIGSGQAKARSFTFDLPNGAAGVGEIEITVAADANNALYEHNAAGTAETNNSAVANATSLATPYPDLTPTGVTITAQGSVRSGAPLTVGWTDRNSGAATANGSWTDRIVITNVTTGEILATLNVAHDPANDGTLAPGASKSRQVTFTLPEGARGVGQIQATVTTDSGNTVHEENAGGTAETNNSASATTTATAGPSTDLQVSDVTVDAAGGVQSGATVTINWTDSNTGAKAAQGIWYDSVVIRNISTAEVLTTLTLPYDPAAAGNTPLAGGGTLARSLTYTLPAGSKGVGDIQVIVTTDAFNQIAEFNAAGAGGASTAEGNNAASVTVASARAPTPDLVVGGMTFSPTTGVQSGDTVTVIWTVTNAGNRAADASFHSKLVIRNATTGTILTTANVLYDAVANGAIDAGGTRTQQFTYTLPKGDPGAGDIAFAVTADIFNAVTEENTAGPNNSSTAEANNEASATLASALAPYADLAVSNVSAPALTIADPAEVTIGWTVTNAGNAATEVGTWVDRIIVSTTGDPAQGTVLKEFVRTGALGAGQSYTRSETFFLPPQYQVHGRLFVVTDHGDAVFENGKDANNTAEAPNLFDVTPAPFADLVVTDLQAPTSGASGKTLAITWTVKNQSPFAIGTTNISEWSDQVYLASDAEGKNSVLSLASFNHVGALAVGGSYTRSAEAPLPITLSGTYYLVVKTGGPHEFFHIDNNIKVSGPITIGLSPADNLVPVTVAATARVRPRW